MLNLRQQRKYQKQRNDYQLDLILSEIGQQFTVQSEQRRDKYKGVYLGEHAACIFSLKECPDWQWGIWLNEEARTIDLFGQHNELMDSLTPDKCFLSYQANLDEGVGLKGIKLLNLVRERPEAAFVYSLKKRKNIARATVQKIYDAFWIQKEEELQRNEEAKLEIWDFCRMIRYRYSFVIEVGLIDRYTSKSKINPRYGLIVTLSNEASESLFAEVTESIKQELNDEIYHSAEQSIELLGVWPETKGLEDCTYFF